MGIENKIDFLKNDLIPSCLYFLKRDSKKGILLSGEIINVSIVEQVFRDTEDFANAKYSIERKIAGNGYKSSEWYEIDVDKYFEILGIWTNYDKLHSTT